METGEDQDLVLVSVHFMRESASYLKTGRFEPGSVVYLVYSCWPPQAARCLALSFLVTEAPQ